MFVTAWGAKDARPSAESPKSLGRQETTGSAAPRRRRVARAREAGAPFLRLMSLPSRLANLSYAQLLEIAVWTLFSAGCRNLEWSTDIYGRKDARTSRLRRYKRNVSMKKNPAFSRPRHLALIFRAACATSLTPRTPRTGARRPCSHCNPR